MIRIGVLSDTHIARADQPLPPALLQRFARVDHILHAGDIACAAVLEALHRLAPLSAVQGNVDPPELAATLPERLTLELGGVRIGLTHGHLGPGADIPGRALRGFQGSPPDVVVFGHSHVPCNRFQGGVRLFNPGSPTQRRAQPRGSFGLLELEKGAVTGQLLYLAPDGSLEIPTDEDAGRDAGPGGA